MCLIHRVRTTGAPVGIAEHLVTSDHQHSTRTRGQLHRPSVKTNAGARRLYFSGIDAYNKLPQDIHEVGITRFTTRVTDCCVTLVRCCLRMSERFLNSVYMWYNRLSCVLYCNVNVLIFSSSVFYIKFLSYWRASRNGHHGCGRVANTCLCLCLWYELVFFFTKGDKFMHRKALQVSAWQLHWFGRYVRKMEGGSKKPPLITRAFNDKMLGS